MERIEIEEEACAVIIERATNAEAQHLGAWFAPLNFGDGLNPEDNLQALANAFLVSLWAVTACTARRHLREHPGKTHEDCETLAADADRIESNVPSHLRAMWDMHYVEGQSVADCAASAHIDPERAQAEYQDIITALTATIATHSGVHRARNTSGSSIPWGEHEARASGILGTGT